MPKNIKKPSKMRVFKLFKNQDYASAAEDSNTT